MTKIFPPSSLSKKTEREIDEMLERVANGTATRHEVRAVQKCLRRQAELHRTDATAAEITERLKVFIGRTITNCHMAVIENGAASIALQVDHKPGFIFFVNKPIDISIVDPLGGTSMQHPMPDPKPKVKTLRAAR